MDTKNRMYYRIMRLYLLEAYSININFTTFTVANIEIHFFPWNSVYFREFPKSECHGIQWISVNVQCSVFIVKSNYILIIAQLKL